MTRLGDVKLRNPYDCPEVMKAVIQDIVSQLQAIFAFELLSPTNVALAQQLADYLAERVEFRGTRLSKLVSIQLFMSPTDLGTLNFTLRPLSDDGRHLLRIISDEPAFPTSPPAPMAIVDPPKTKIRRIVEI